MPRQPAGTSRRVLQAILLLLIAAELALAVLVVVLYRAGRAPVLDVATQHRIAFAWVLFTVVAAVGAYVLGGGAGEQPRAGFGRALAVAGLTGLAACAGALAFLVVPVWPILAISVLTALLGLVLAWPRAELSVAEAEAAPGAPEAPQADAAPAVVGRADGARATPGAPGAR